MSDLAGLMKFGTSLGMYFGYIHGSKGFLLHPETNIVESMKIEKMMFALLFPPLLMGCHGKDGQQESVLPVPVKIMKVDAGQSLEETYSGTIEEENGTPLSFPIAGTVQGLHIHLGQQVRKGQLVATLDPASLQSSYNAAHAGMLQAEDAYRRLKELHEKGSLPDIKWIEVKSRLEQARSVEQIAWKNLEDSKLYAPFSGVIAEKNVEVGQHVMPGMPVAKLVTAAALKVKIAVPEAEMSSVFIGQKAKCSVPALGAGTFAADVVEKGITAHPFSRSYDVKLKVTGAAEGLLPGMVADVVLLSGDKGGEQEASCVIPASVVQIDEGNHTFVWVVEGGKAHKRVIGCGAYTAEGVAVCEGLSAGDSIIIAGQQKVCEGTEVVL